MEPFTVYTGLAAPLDRANIDTDQIIPKQYLSLLDRQGVGRGLFNDWRYLDGDPERPNPGFVLNQPRYRGAGVLIVGDNFGCGSSREHAPWALLEFGIRCVVSTSFADIFYNNSIKNGLLPAVVEEEDRRELVRLAQEVEGLTLTVDLPAQRIRASSGFECGFTIPEHARASLLRGLDDIEATLGHLEEIEAWEARAARERPWLNP